MFKNSRNPSRFLVLLTILLLVNNEMISSRAVIRTETHRIDASPHNHKAVVFDGPEE
jgi:hypothetical protein